MGDSACLMQQPFSYAAGIPSEAQEVNSLHALGQSVSFGRFMSEKLDWEKWSTFSSHRRYVEEAESYARPGSVAQKKAFFEAHYKKIAEARKAAALLEQANNAAPDSAGVAESGAVEAQESQTESTSCEKQENEEEIQKPEAEAGLTIDEVKLNDQKDDLEEERVLLENSMRVDLRNKLGFRGGDGGRRTVIKEVTQKENYIKVEPLKKTSYINKKDENLEMEQRRKTQVVKPPSKTLKSILEDSNSTKSRPAKAKACLKKENSSAPIAKISKTNLKNKPGSSPKTSCQKSYSFTASKEFNRLTTIIRKIDSSKASSSSKPCKDDSTTPLQTPNTASAAAASKSLLATPLSENRRGRIAYGSSATGSKAVRPRWHFLPTENKSFSPSCFTPFRLRTDERAERRKKKLEEKLKPIESQKQQQETLKEKAGTELRKLRRSLCFKARPLPNFYKERGTSKDQEIKAPLVGHQSPVPERNPPGKVCSRRSH